MSYEVQVCMNEGWKTLEVVPDLAAVTVAEDRLKRNGWGTSAIRHQKVELKVVKG